MPKLTWEGRRWRASIALAVAGSVWLATLVRPTAWPPGLVVEAVVTGIGAGALAAGLVLTYRTFRIINFAYGAMGSVGAEVGLIAYQVHDLPWVVCVAIAVLAGVAVGLGVDGVMRRFRDAPRLVVTVATIGLLQVLIGLQVAAAYAAGAPLVVPPFRTELTDTSFRVDTSLFNLNHLLAAGVVGALLALLAWFMLRTDAGAAVRAIADNRERAQLLGVPITRLSRLVWVIVSVLAAGVMVTYAPSNGLPFNPWVSAGGIFLPALVAAVVAKMDDLPMAFAVAIGLSIFSTIASYNITKNSLVIVLLLVVVAVALLVRRWKVDRADVAESSWALAGEGRPLPDAVAHLPEIVWGRRLLLAALGAAALWLPLVSSPSRTHILTGYLVLGLAVVSLVILSGWAGTISLGQGGIVGVGAVAAGALISRTNADMFLALVLAAAAGAAVSVLIGLPALRVRPIFLAVTTLIFAAAMDQFFLNPTNFPDLIPGSIQRPVLWKRFPLQAERSMYYLCLATLAVAVVVAHVLRRSRPGRVLLACRDNENAAAAMAVPPVRVRVTGMALAGIFAGLAGALAGLLERGVATSSFPTELSVLLFSMAVVGGLGSISGALCGVVLIQVLVEVISGMGDQGARLASLGTGTLMLLVLLALPGGVGQGVERIRDRLAGLIARRHGVALEVGAAAGSLALDAGPAEPDRPAATASHPSEPADVALSLRGVDAAYGPLQVLFDVDLEVRRGEMVALLGTNGAGKSSVLRAVTNLLPPSSGQITVGGRRVDGLRTEHVAGRGVALMPGGRGIFPTLTVADNLRIASWPIRHDADRVRAAIEDAHERFPILWTRGDQRAGNLSGGEQQQLSLAMAFLTRPPLLLIDELSLGLAPTVVGALVEQVREIHATGTTVVVVEQSIDTAMQLAQRAVFMEKGKVRFEGRTADLLDRPDILRSVFFEPVGSTSPPSGHARADTTQPVRERGLGLRCEGLVKRFGGIVAINHLDLNVEPGTIVGLVGHNGAGKTTLFDLISGFLKPDAGTILLGDEDISGLPPARRAVLGLGRSFQEARLFPSLTVTETVVVALDRHLTSQGWTAAALALPAAVDADGAALQRATEIIGQMGLAGYASTPISELSTGTRRVVELACAVAIDPPILLLDEPSAGIAQRESEALGRRLRDVHAETGSAIVVIEHDLGLLTSLCDELVALELGSVICRGATGDVLADPRVIASYLGTREVGEAPAQRRRRRPLRAAPTQQTNSHA